MPYANYVRSANVSDSLENIRERLKYIRLTFLIKQARDEFQLTVAKQLDIPHGHVNDLQSYLSLCRDNKVTVVNVEPQASLRLDGDIIQTILLKDCNKGMNDIFLDISARLFSQFIKDQGRVDEDCVRQ